MLHFLVNAVPVFSHRADAAITYFNRWFRDRIARNVDSLQALHGAYPHRNFRQEVVHHLERSKRLELIKIIGKPDNVVVAQIQFFQVRQ